MRHMTTLAAALAVAGPAGALAQGVETTATLYVWGTAVTQELANGAEVEADFDDILDNLDFALMGEVVQRRGPWIYGLELFYADISAGGDARFPVASDEPEPSEIEAGVGFETSTTIVSAFAGYQMTTDPQLRLYGTGGLRYTRFENTLTVDTDFASFEFEADDNLTDVVVGLRGRWFVDENWSVPFILDFGGGGSDMTYQAFAGVSYSWGRNAVTVGYRQLYWDLGDSSDILKEVTYGGPLIAYSRTF